VAKVAVELDREAQRDLRKLHPDDHRTALRAMAHALTHEPLPANANDRALKGRAPWRRAIGNGERRRVARVIHRRDLERAVRTLDD
jgi:hypothetical protein